MWTVKTIVIAAAVAVFALPGWFMRSRKSAAPLDAPPRTIAVLPFKPLHAERRDEPLELGICNALIRRLGTLDQLIITPTSSVTGYTQTDRDPLAAGRRYAGWCKTWVVLSTQEMVSLSNRRKTWSRRVGKATGRACVRCRAHHSSGEF